MFVSLNLKVQFENYVEQLNVNTKLSTHKNYSNLSNSLSLLGESNGNPNVRQIVLKLISSENNVYLYLVFIYICLFIILNKLAKTIEQTVSMLLLWSKYNFVFTRILHLQSHTLYYAIAQRSDIGKDTAIRDLFCFYNWWTLKYAMVIKNYVILVGLLQNLYLYIIWLTSTFL